MIDLQKEAENYCNNNYPHYLDKKEALLVQEDFIAGVNSKYVQAKILKAQIDVLNMSYGDQMLQLMRLEEQLRQLENER